MTVRAVIDIGSHSVLLLVADASVGQPKVLSEQYCITALGSGLGQTGMIDPEAATRTRRVIDSYLATCRELVADQVILVGTAALREARNQGEIISMLSGLPIRVLSREEEAELTRRGALSGLEGADDALVCDLGGRSTEITWPGVQASLPIGCQRGREDHLASDPPTAEEIARLRAAVQEVLPPAPPTDTLVASGGTATTLASMDQKLPEYRREAVHGRRISRGRLNQLIRRLVSVPLEERENLAGIEPGRAEVLPAGAVILDELCGWCRRDELLVSARGLTWGVWLSGG
jgi:exopolyphosphatase/guanosine-5'-triphosphate,3'-diphosphate pyrophosphatase